MSPTLAQSLAARLPGVEINSSNPDELRLIGPSLPVEGPADVSVWLQTLREPLMKNFCVQLRFTIEGWTWLDSNACSTFVFCGQPTIDGKLLLKAIWPLSHQEHEALIFRATKWPDETVLLDAWQMYRSLRQSDGAARQAYDAFAPRLKRLFMTRRQDRLVMMLTRYLAELPDDRGPAGFFRRVSMPLALGGAALALSASRIARSPDAWLLLVFPGLMFLFSLSVIWRKLLQIRRYRDTMRKGLASIYTRPVKFELTDLSADTTSTLLKLSADIESLGGVHLCDIAMTTEKLSLDANRIYRIGDTLATFGILRKAVNLLIFPPKPVILLSTEFTNGQRHVTKNRAQYRKGMDIPQITMKCMENEEAGFAEVFALHRQYVDQLIASGMTPVSPPRTSQQLLEQMRDDHELAKESWKKAPYSRSDALHESFKICRREFRPD